MIKLGESRLTKSPLIWIRGLDAELIYYHITGADRVELSCGAENRWMRRRRSAILT